jgi:hypothetical protein
MKARPQRTTNRRYEAVLGLWNQVWYWNEQNELYRLLVKDELVEAAVLWGQRLIRPRIWNMIGIGVVGVGNSIALKKRKKDQPTNQKLITQNWWRMKIEKVERIIDL